MLLERSPVAVGLVAAVVIGVATTFAIAVSGDLFRTGTPIVAEFENSEGLKPGDDVMVAGIRAGSVDDVRIVGDRVEIHLVVEPEIARDASARIVLRNILGRRAVEVLPGSDWDDLMADEDDPRIPLDRTSSLVDIPDLGDETVALLRDSDVDALETLIVSLADVTEDQRDEVGELLDGLRRFSAVLADNRDDLERLIVRAETVVDAAADRDQELVTIIDEFGSTLDTLVRRRAEVVRFLDETASSTTAVADLVGDERERIDRVLAELHDVLEIADRHQVDIAHSFAYGGVAFYGFSQVGAEGEGDTPYWGNILTTGAGQLGIDAFAGCGGVLDEFLDEVFGEETECPEAGGPSAPDSDASGISGDGGDAMSDGDEPVPSLPSFGQLFTGGLR